MYSVQRPGGYAEFALAPVRAVFPLPGPEWYDAAAAGQIVFTTAWHMLMTRAQLRAGETVVVSASGSGVGHAAVQIAKLAGATVIATAGSDEKLARSREDGADHVVNYGKDDVTARVLDFTGGRGADIVIEHIGGEQFGACLNSLRKNGRLITCGGHAGEAMTLRAALFAFEIANAPFWPRHSTGDWISTIAFGVVALAGLLVAIAVIKHSFTTRKTKTTTA